MPRPGGTEDRTSRRLERGALLLGLLVVAITFAPVARYGFVTWDDGLYVLENPAVVGPRGAVGLEDRLLTPSLGYPAPVTVATYAVEHALFGISPTPYHLTNLGLHLAVCALLYLAARRLGVGVAAASIAATLFGIHPAVAEPVSWVSGRKELLAAVFSLGALVELLREPEPRGARRWAVVGLLLLGALSKPTTLFLVPLVFVLELVVRRRGVARAVVRTLPVAAVGAVVFGVSLLGQRAVHAVRDVSGGSGVLREAWYALGFHLGLVFGVQTPCVKHFPAAWPLRFEPAVDLFPLAVALVVALGAWTLRREGPERRRAYVVALAWAVLAYLPSSSLIPLTRYLADSYVYLPLAGLSLAVAVVVDRLAWPRVPLVARASGVAITAVTLGLAVAARGASLHWVDDVALWGHAHARYPDEYRICRNLGNAYVARNRADTALWLYENCATRSSREPFRKNIAIALFVLGRQEDARRAFLEMAAETPEDPLVRKYLRLLGVEVVRAPASSAEH